MCVHVCTCTRIGKGPQCGSEPSVLPQSSACAWFNSLLTSSRAWSSQPLSASYAVAAENFPFLKFPLKQWAMILVHPPRQCLSLQCTDITITSRLRSSVHAASPPAKVQLETWRTPRAKVPSSMGSPQSRTSLFSDGFFFPLMLS